MQDNDQRDRELLGALQGEIPLVSTPFAVIGQSLDMSEKEVIKRTERLKRDGLIRQISALFDTRSLGYKSCLVAARVADDEIDTAAAVISAHPGVTQNYKRNNDFNLWFTIAVAPSSKLGLDRTIEILGDEAGCEVVRQLPTLKLFKSAGSEGSDTHAGESESNADVTSLSVVEIEAVRILQRDLPLQPRPFDVMARNAGIGPDELLASARALQKRGQMRRFTASIQARKPGFTASAMAIWVVPEAQIDSFGAQLSQHKAVSHCYLRPVYPDWPYNLYTTVHGRSVDECESIINDLAIDTGLTQKQALFPTKEYKKTRISLFAPDLEEWEAAHSSRSAAAAS